MRNAIVLNMESVRKHDIERALLAHGHTWNHVAHITATNSLCRGILDSHAIGVTISTLIDLLLVPRYHEGGVPLNTFPRAAVFRQSRQRYRTQNEKWSRAVNSRLIAQRMAFDDSIYGYYRDAKENRSVLKSMYESRSAFAGTVYSLNASGVDPSNLTPSTLESDVATALWQYLEQKIPSLSHVRKHIWIDAEEYQRQQTEFSKSLRQSIYQVLDHVFGTVDGVRTIVHHGFYFYTPVQWALFQLLDATPGIQQIFITQDRYDSPVFEVWRKFFQEKWGFPKGLLHTTAETITPAAGSLIAALSGTHVDAAALDGRVTLLECKNAPEFVVHVNYHAKLAQMNAEAATVEIPLLYAADSKTVNRFFERLSGGVNASQVNLAKLPIGTFLLRVHESIRIDQRDNVEYTLRQDAFRDIIATGFLHVDGKSTQTLLPAVRRVLPYFERCRTLKEWIVRAKKLEKIVSELVPHGDVTPAQSTNAGRKLRKKANNPFVLIQWLDINIEEAKTIRKSLEALLTLLESLAQTERVSLSEYFRVMIPHLQQGMSSLDTYERSVIEEKIAGMSDSSTEEVFVVSLTDLIAMLVGRTVEFSTIGEVIDDEARFRSIRSLDLFGLLRSEFPLHIANLYDGVFPSQIRTIGWPFNRADLADAMDPVAIQLLELGEQCTPMGDIYLLWLALDGVEAPITLSWMNELEGEHLNKSTLVELLARLQLPHGMKGVVERIGGIPLQYAQRPSYGQPVFAAPQVETAPSETVTAAHSALQQIDKNALSAYDVCERRLMLQWVLGNSPAYRAPHLQSMVYGNIRGIASHKPSWNRSLIDFIGDKYTTGQLRSADASAVVKPPGQPSARPEIVYTLRGTKSGQDRLSRGYQRARGDNVALQPIPDGAHFLPPRSTTVTETECKFCPVRDVCAAASHDEED